MTLAQIVKSRTELSAKIEAHKESHNQAMRDFAFEMGELDRSEQMLMSGLDLSKIQLAEHVLLIGMYQQLAGDDRKEIAAAIADLANGAPVMRGAYFGTKNYDRFYHQGVGPTQYGYGPRHGSAVFTIGLTAPLRSRGEQTPRDLTADEIDAAIYLLKMLEAGKYKLNDKTGAA